jgi:hypothetical protein
MKMKLFNALLIGSIALLSVACSSTRYVSSEYDDVYYTSEDDATYADNNSREDRTQERYSRPSNYNDAYYEEDDFYFSRRIRRFNTPGRVAWRYYDPFFTNDLYFVMNTPSWNRWYGNGWYDWNRPRFGASIGFGMNAGWGGGWGGWGPMGAYDPWGAYAPWQSFGYYNPWVNAYYGYSPFAFNSPFVNPYWAGGGFGGAGFGNPFWGGGGAYYCPPAYGLGNASSPASTSNWRNYQQAHRASSRGVSTKVTSGNINNGGKNVGRNVDGGVRRQGQSSGLTETGRVTGTRTTDNSRYLQPRSRTGSQIDARGVRQGTLTPQNQVGTRTQPSRIIRDTNDPSRTIRPGGRNNQIRPSNSNVPTNRSRTITPNRNDNRPTRTIRPSNNNRNNNIRPASPTPSRSRTIRPSSPSPSRSISPPPSRSISRPPSGGSSIRRSSGSSISPSRSTGTRSSSGNRSGGRRP